MSTKKKATGPKVGDIVLFHHREASGGGEHPAMVTAVNEDRLNLHVFEDGAGPFVVKNAIPLTDQARGQMSCHSNDTMLVRVEKCALHMGLTHLEPGMDIKLAEVLGLYMKLDREAAIKAYQQSVLDPKPDEPEEEPKEVH